MGRTYNQQNSDGSWTQVTQNDSGGYTSVPIDPSGYAAANIPGATGADPNAAGGYGYDPGAATLRETQITDAAKIAYDKASLAATQAYQQGMLANLGERLSFDKATEAFNETFRQNTLNWTVQEQTAALTGMLNGQSTLAGQQQGWQQQFNSDQLMGSRNGQPTLQAQQDRNTTGLGYLNLLASLKGPANAFEYAKVLGGTPGGIADIVRAAGGQYQMPTTGGGSGGQPVPMSIDSLINNVNQYSPSGPGASPPSSPGGLSSSYAPWSPTGMNPNNTPTPGTAPGTQSGSTYNTVNGPKTVAQMGAELHAAGWGGNVTDPAAVSAAYGSTTKSPVTMVQPITALPTTTNTVPAATPAYATTAGTSAPLSPGASAQPTSSYIPSYGDLPPPNQISPQNWQNMVPGQQNLLMGAYGNAGWDPNDVAAMMKNSLRGYGGPTSGTVGF